MEAVWNQRAMETVAFVEEELLPTASIVALQEFWYVGGGGVGTGAGVGGGAAADDDAECW